MNLLISEVAEEVTGVISVITKWDCIVERHRYFCL